MMGRREPDAGSWATLVRESVTAPRRAASKLLAMGLSPAILVQAALAITCAGMVLGFVAMRLSGGSVDPISSAVLGAPFFGVLTQLGLMALVVGLTDRIGALFGGRGTLWGALGVVVWLNGLTLLMQVLQILLLIVAPPVSGLVGIVTLFWVMWAYANFVAELHGFEQPLVVLGVTILTVIMVALGLTIVARLLGVMA